MTLVMVDDHPLVRSALLQLLRAQGLEVAGEGSRRADLVPLLARHRPTVAVVDLLLPDGPVTDALAAAREASPGTAFFVLTSADDDSQLLLVMRARVEGFWLKTAHPEQLVAGVLEVARGRRSIDPEVAARLASLEGRGPSAAALQRLTDRELETLAALGRGETNQQMAESMGVAVVTVKTHVSNVLAKLGLRDRTEAAVFAWRAGVVR